MARASAIELHRIVCAKDGDLVTVFRDELAKPLLVGFSRFAVNVGASLHRTQNEGRVRLRLDLAVEVVAIARVQKPAIASSDGDARLPVRMSA